MTAAGKIRVLLLLLCASLLFTAIIVQNTYTPLNSLDQTARTLEDNLHRKERDIKQLLDDKTSFNQLKTLADSPATAFTFINNYTTDRGIWFVTVKNDTLSFWSGIKIIPTPPATISEGRSFIQGTNGYYEAIKKTEGDFSVIFFILVKIDYAFENQYLQNKFSPELLKDNVIDLANVSDRDIYNIRSIDNVNLFWVKLKPGAINQRVFYFEFLIWAITLLCFCLLINNISKYVARRGYVFASLLLMAIFIIGARFVNLHYHWPSLIDRLNFFDPKYYSSGYLYPSFGDLCVNILFVSWFMLFLYVQRNKLLKKSPNKFIGYSILVGAILLLIIVSTGLLNIFYGLVVNSKISFDLNNFLNFSVFSCVGILMLCVCFMIFYLLSEVLLTVVFKIDLPDRYKLFLFVTAIVLITAIVSYQQSFTLFYVLWASLVLLRAYAYRYRDGRLDSLSFVIIILICTIISSIKLSYFEGVKENRTRMAFMQKLAVQRDVRSEGIFKNIEKRIIKDPVIIDYLKNHLYHVNYIKNRLQKLYFNGYLSQYEAQVYEFDDQDKPLSGDSDQDYDLDVFKDLVLYSSFKVSGNFYRANEAFGFQNYFAILPVVANNKDLGTIVIELKSKPIQQFVSFPDLLIDINNQEKLGDEFKAYSYALYNDNRLYSQSGNYLYDVKNTNLKGRLKSYVFKTTPSNNKEWYSAFTTYSHYIYKTTPRNLIVVSKEENKVFYVITSVTFFFVIFLAFGGLVVLARWLWLRIKILNIKNDRVGWNFKMNFDLVLYKTRIQFSMIFAVVITLLMVGFITFFSISTQYQNQQDKAIRDKLNRIATTLEKGELSKYLSNINEEKQVSFNDFAATFSADLTLYDLNGAELINTQPKIYEFGLQARRMNARAFLNLSKLQKSEFVNDETIGQLKYKAVYVPLRTATNTVAYLQLPYFANEADYRERIGALLNVMINVYALVFIAIGLFAVLIARQITAPLNFIQHSLSKTIYGQKNEPIKWTRNDEIGALVKEYNKMIAALENSAQKLAQSERESAWREMAKQVAHEIKNPLTPLKLGLQLLDKSWRDKDPKFDQKFERFSKSFVEQIESLSSIASEFSAFAKMPDTRIERINIFDILSQVVIIFKEMDNIRILYQAPEAPFIINADRDQLLRCFNNLLKNAIEATPAERQGIIDINYVLTSKNILLTIKDNGQGIPENLREKIFEPNFTTKSSGTGLGLAFVKNSIENAGGKVWFETTLGEGTTFYFSLPSA